MSSLGSLDNALAWILLKAVTPIFEVPYATRKRKLSEQKFQFITTVNPLLSPSGPLSNNSPPSKKLPFLGEES